MGTVLLLSIARPHQPPLPPLPPVAPPKPPLPLDVTNDEDDAPTEGGRVQLSTVEVLDSQRPSLLQVAVAPPQASP